MKNAIKVEFPSYERNGLLIHTIDTTKDETAISYIMKLFGVIILAKNLVTINEYEILQLKKLKYLILEDTSGLFTILLSRDDVNMLYLSIDKETILGKAVAQYFINSNIVDEHNILSGDKKYGNVNIKKILALINNAESIYDTEFDIKRLLTKYNECEDKEFVWCTIMHDGVIWESGLISEDVAKQKCEDDWKEYNDIYEGELTYRQMTGVELSNYIN